MVSKTLLEISRELARVALEIGAIQLNPEDPFIWASGYHMPVYNDNRLLLGLGEHRTLVGRGFQEIIRHENLALDVVAGTSTAGIPHATTLANLLDLPLIYVRSKPKGHGMQNQVEGLIKTHQKVIVIEDLVSTGASALTQAHSQMVIRHVLLVPLIARSQLLRNHDIFCAYNPYVCKGFFRQSRFYHVY